jgi:hypothetical protein
MTAAHLYGLDQAKPYMVRAFGEGDDAWQIVPPNGTTPSLVRDQLPSGIPGEPDKTVWTDTVTVTFEDGNWRVFNPGDQVEVRAP